MSAWRMSRLEFSATDLAQMRQTLQVNPGYQREGRLWSKDRRQRFIDSLINQLDVPPIYLHRLSPPKIDDGAMRSYAVIDGRQRLDALWGFLEGEYRLMESAQVLADEGVGPTSDDSDISGLSIDELRERRPDLHVALLNYRFAVTVIETDDTTLIEEMFFRLNEGVPLTPAEKRFRGELLREVVGRMVDEKRLLSMLRYSNRRRAHEDIVLRLLFIEASIEAGVPYPDLKKRDLDEFAARFGPDRLGLPDDAEAAARKRADLEGLARAVEAVVEKMRTVFGERDELLRQSSWFLSYYLAFRNTAGEVMLSRETLINFFAAIEALNGREEGSMSALDFEALDVAGPLPATTTGSYFEMRVTFLLRYAAGEIRANAEAGSMEPVFTLAEGAGRGADVSA